MLTLLGKLTANWGWRRALLGAATLTAAGLLHAFGFLVSIPSGVTQFVDIHFVTQLSFNFALIASVVLLFYRVLLSFGFFIDTLLSKSSLVSRSKRKKFEFLYFLFCVCFAILTLWGAYTGFTAPISSGHTATMPFYMIVFVLLAMIIGLFVAVSTRQNKFGKARLIVENRAVIILFPIALVLMISFLMGASRYQYVLNYMTFRKANISIDGYPYSLLGQTSKGYIFVGNKGGIFRVVSAEGTPIAKVCYPYFSNQSKVCSDIQDWGDTPRESW